MPEETPETTPDAPKDEREKNAPKRSNLPWIIGPVAAFIVLIVLILSTGTPSSAQLMKHAASSFGDVSRGNFLFKITITPQGSTASPSTISLQGPFEILPGKPLPKAKITYTVSSGGRSQVTTLLTTGTKAYTVIKGQAYELPDSATKELKAATKDLNKPGQGKGLSGIQLHFDKWLIDPQVSNGGSVNGAAVWRTTAGVNVVNALKDLVASSGALSGIAGSAVPALKQSEIDEIKKGISNAKVMVYVGRYDKIIRLLDLTMDFSNTGATGSTSSTSTIPGGKMNLVVGITKPNEPVDVQPPKDPLPYSALQSLVQSRTSQTGTALDDGVGQ